MTLHGLPRAAALTLALLLSRAELAQAAPDWLPTDGRALPLAATASRDAPVTELAYGPRAQLSVGHALPLLRWPGEPAVQLTATARAALEDAADPALLPDELARFQGGLRATFTWAGADLARVFGPGSAVELGLELGLERARELIADPASRAPLPFPADGIPFGAGGLWLGFDLSWRLPLAPRWTLTARLGDRVFTNAFPALVGLIAESQAVASSLGEGLAHAPSLMAGLRWEASAELAPTLMVTLEGLLPHDDSASASHRLRAVLGLGLPGAAGELLPFVAVEHGAGYGLLVNRHELRLALGVRLALR